MGKLTSNSCRLSVMLSMTFGFFLVEIITGYITHSMALVADSFHMLSDVLALCIAFACMKISKKKSAINTFGWVRAEVLGALINAVFLLALCFSLFVEALKRLFEPEQVEHPDRVLYVGIIGLVVNIIGIFMFHGHASIHGHSHARPIPVAEPARDHDLGVDSDSDSAEEEPEGFNFVATEAHSILAFKDMQSDSQPDSTPIGHDRSEQQLIAASQKSANGTLGSPSEKSAFSPSTETSVRRRGDSSSAKSGKKHKGHADSSQLNMHGVFLHILGDAFGSVIVIVNAAVMWQVPNDDLKTYLDPSLTLVMVVIIASSTIPLLKESAQILLQTVPSHMNISVIKQKLVKNVAGILGVHEFHLWRLAGNKIIVSAHIQCQAQDYMRVAEAVKEFFHNEGVHSTTIQPEFVETTSTSSPTDQNQMPGGAVVTPVAAECMLTCRDDSVCPPALHCCNEELTSVEPRDTKGGQVLSNV